MKPARERMFDPFESFVFFFLWASNRRWASSRLHAKSRDSYDSIQNARFVV